MVLNEPQGRSGRSAAGVEKVSASPGARSSQEPENGDKKNSPEVSAPPKRPAFGFFSIGARIIVALAIVAVAVYFANQLIASRPEPVERKQFERSFTVEVVEARFGTYAPEVEAFGEIVAANTLNIRAPAAGDVIYVAPELRAGGEVKAGQVLVRVDPFDYQLALADARTNLADARSALSEAQEQLRIQRLNVEYAQNSLKLAQADLDRANALYQSGSITSQQLETRELVVSQRDQALRQAQSSIVLLQAGVARKTTAIETASRNVERAQRALDETAISTPYDAVVISSNVVPGATFSQGEAVASLYQADAFEVRFTLSEVQYGQLQQAGLMGIEARVVWDIGPDPVVLHGTVQRIGARVDPTKGGVELFAVLEEQPGIALRPGTFVTVHLPGVAYEGVLSIPETALYEADNFYVMQEGRMKSVPGRVLAHDGKNLIVEARVEPGAKIITTRLAQAGEGVRVNLEGEEPVSGDVGQENQRPANRPEASQRPANGPGGSQGDADQERPESDAPASPAADGG